MSTLRQALLIASLASALAIRWLDPLGSPADDAAPASAAVERINSVPAAVTSSASNPQATSIGPVRSPLVSPKNADLFVSRSTTEAQLLSAKRPPPPPTPPPYVAPPPPAPPPPPPPPQEPAPAVQVIGTWGVEADISVFVSTPLGILHIRTGDTVMSDYQVQSVSKQQLILVNQRTKKTWQLAIPDAPSALKTWPGR